MRSIFQAVSITHHLENEDSASNIETNINVPTKSVQYIGSAESADSWRFLAYLQEFHLLTVIRMAMPTVRHGFDWPSVETRVS